MPKINKKNFLKLLPEEYRKQYEDEWIHNYSVEVEEITKNYKFSPQIIFSDCTCRDGEQQAGVVFTPEQKVEIVQLLTEVGIQLCEIGFPGVSKEEEDACKLIINNSNANCYVLSRAIKKDIDAAIRTNARVINIFTSCSEFHIRTKMGLTPESNLEQCLRMTEYAADHGINIIFGMEDVSRASINYYVEFIESVKEVAGKYWGGTSISDTVGAFNPITSKWLYRNIKNRLNFDVGLHFHNDNGLALANTLACLEEGAVACSGTILGLGERCGNTALEEVFVSLRTIYGLKLRIQYNKLIELCDMVSKYAGIPIPPNKPVCGMNAFKHESGIHTHGVIEHPHIYEFVPHKLLGRKSEFVYGKFSGTRAVLEEVLKPYGIVPNKDQLKEIVTKIKEIQTKQETERKKERVQFVNDFYQTISQMALSSEEVLKIAKKVVN
ncbi:MAG: homoaconitate hydratase [Promethearchaeota archaeon]